MWELVMTDSQPRVNPVLYKAIEERRLIRLRYNDRERIVEPHDCGVHKGVVKLLAYQVGGSSSHKLPNWRWLEEDSMSDIELLSESFAGGRPTESGEHHRWEELFIRVKPHDKRRK
jgi:predicted DNA-binding transcriptional regulator YafY